jgi:hypothetical protein
MSYIAVKQVVFAAYLSLAGTKTSCILFLLPVYTQFFITLSSVHVLLLLLITSRDVELNGIAQRSQERKTFHVYLEVIEIQIGSFAAVKNRFRIARNKKAR